MMLVVIKHYCLLLDWYLLIDLLKYTTSKCEYTPEYRKMEDTNSKQNQHFGQKQARQVIKIICAYLHINILINHYIRYICVQ